MKRKIIKIDEKKCTGCGLCVQGCPEGALQVIDGKARLVGELLCDGLGACIGTCPEGAILLEDREAESYDERQVIEYIVNQGENVLAAHLTHLRDHHQTEYLKIAMQYLKEHEITAPQANFTPGEHHNHAGCPGMATREIRSKKDADAASAGEFGSELGQWPIQLQLLNPGAPYFRNADLLIAADCVPFAYANFHQRFLKGKTLIILCPKLDRVKEQYIEKLTAIFQNNEIKSVSILHMEVSCCFGTLSLVEESLKKSGKNIILKDYTISIDGRII